jgi:hypothetical protein
LRAVAADEAAGDAAVVVGALAVAAGPGVGRGLVAAHGRVAVPGRVAARGQVPAHDPVAAGTGQAPIVRPRLASLAVGERTPVLDRVAALGPAVALGRVEGDPTSAAGLAAADRTSVAGLVAGDRTSAVDQAVVAVQELAAGQVAVRGSRPCLPRDRTSAAGQEWATGLERATGQERATGLGLVLGQAAAQGSRPCLPRDRTSGLAAPDRGPVVSAADRVCRLCLRWVLGLRSVRAWQTAWATVRQPRCRVWATSGQEPANSPPIQSATGATH